MSRTEQMLAIRDAGRPQQPDPLARLLMAAAGREVMPDPWRDHVRVACVITDPPRAARDTAFVLSPRLTKPRIRPTTESERAIWQCGAWCVSMGDGYAYFGDTWQAAWRNFAGA